MKDSVENVLNLLQWLFIICCEPEVQKVSHRVEEQWGQCSRANPSDTVGFSVYCIAMHTCCIICDVTLGERLSVCLDEG